MKKLTITLTCNNNTETVNVKSEAAMWNQLRAVRPTLTDADLTAGVRAIVTVDETGEVFKDITFRRNSKGKIEMPNAVKETCRCRVAKAKALKAKETEAVEASVAEVEAVPAE